MASTLVSENKREHPSQRSNCINTINSQKKELKIGSGGDLGWTCLLCTYENHAHNALTRCEICLTPRPVRWSCQKCGITNASEFRSLENDHLCRKCSEKNHDIEKLKVARKVDGNWDCPKCSSNNSWYRNFCTTCKYDHLEIDSLSQEFRSILSSTPPNSSVVSVSSLPVETKTEAENPTSRKVAYSIDGVWTCTRCTTNNVYFRNFCYVCNYEPSQILHKHGLNSSSNHLSTIESESIKSKLKFKEKVAVYRKLHDNWICPECSTSVHFDCDICSKCNFQPSEIIIISAEEEKVLKEMEQTLEIKEMETNSYSESVAEEFPFPFSLSDSSDLSNVSESDTKSLTKEEKIVIRDRNDGSWVCIRCTNMNYYYQISCSRCKIIPSKIDPIPQHVICPRQPTQPTQPDNHSHLTNEAKSHDKYAIPKIETKSETSSGEESNFSSPPIATSLSSSSSPLSNVPN